MTTNEGIFDYHCGWGEASGTGNGSGAGNGSGTSSGRGRYHAFNFADGSGQDSGYPYSGSGSLDGYDCCWGSACGAAG
jgi:hypothetical protein